MASRKANIRSKRSPAGGFDSSSLRFPKWMVTGGVAMNAKFEQRRLASSIDFDTFMETDRVRSLKTGSANREGPVLYWLVRDQRVQDNWAAIYAQMLAHRFNKPLIFCYCMPRQYLNATYRRFSFLIEGLRSMWAQLKKLNIPFELLLGTADRQIPKIVKDLGVSHLVTDFLPIKPVTMWVDSICTSLHKDVQFDQVDAHNIIPCWVTSDHQEYAARTIRPKIVSLMKTYLTEFPALVKQRKPLLNGVDVNIEEPDWEDILENYVKANRNVPEWTTFKAGLHAGYDQLAYFLRGGVKRYGTDRNNPCLPDGLSNLSPWIQFGQISMQRCILVMEEVKQHSDPLTRQSVDVFIEESVVRRELSDNFCFYQPNNYDSLKSAANWARQTLNKHRRDKREHVYSARELEYAETDEPLWNAAQLQMMKEGKMHGFMRMYWAKKVLEWTSSPEDALSIAIYLNDKYSIDGCSPNGYVGIMWSICGIHDRAFLERPVIGKIRPMTSAGCARKFDVQQYTKRYDQEEK